MVKLTYPQLSSYPRMKRPCPRPQSSKQSRLNPLQLKLLSQNLCYPWRQPLLSNPRLFNSRIFPQRVRTILIFQSSSPLHSQNKWFFSLLFPSRHRGRYLSIRGAHLHHHHAWPTRAHVASQVDAQGAAHRRKGAQSHDPQLRHLSPAHLALRTNGKDDSTS